MIPIIFNKARAVELLDSIRDGKPIQPQEAGWTTHDLMQVAGAFFFAAMTRGPMKFQLDKEKYEGLPKEALEFHEDQFFNDLHGAVQLHCELSMNVLDNEYDQRYDDEVVALIKFDPQEGITVKRIDGFKEHQTP